MSTAAVLRLLRRRFGAAAPDNDLLRAYTATGDAEAFRAMVERHGPMVLRLCRRRLGDAHDADDAFQGTFLTLARFATSVRRPEALAAWLYRTALRVCGQARKAQMRREAAEARVTMRTPNDPATELSARELLDVLDEELDRLPERHRLPLALVYWQGLTHAEAARRLSLTPGALHGRLERGRARLADRLRQRGFAPGDLRALLVAPLTIAAVPRDLLAATTALASAPWSSSIPATVLALTAAAVTPKLVPAALLVVGLAGVGLLGLATGSLQPPAPAKADLPPPAAAQGAPRLDRHGDPLPPGAVLRLGTLRYRTNNPMTHLSVRPGGRQVAFCNGWIVAIMDLDTGQTIRRINGGTRLIDGIELPVALTALAFAPDGRTFAAGTVGRRNVGRPAPFWLFDTATGARLREFASFHEQVQALAFLADGKQIASFGEDGCVRIWDITTGAKLRELDGPDRKLTSFAASPDGRTLATGAAARDGVAAVYLWDAASGQLLRTLAGHTADVQAVAFAPDGRTLASGGNATVRLWDVATGRELRQLQGHTKQGTFSSPRSIRLLAFSPDGQTVASASTDGTARTWSVATGEALDGVAGVSPQALAFRDARTLLIADNLNLRGQGWQTLLLRDLTARAYKNRDVSSRYGIVFVAFAADGRTIVTTESVGATHTWSAVDGRHLSSKLWSRQSILTLISPDGRLVGFTEKDGEYVPCIGDMATGQVLRRLPENNQLGWAFSPDGRRLVTGRTTTPEPPELPTHYIWDTTIGAKLGQLSVSLSNVLAIAFAHDGQSVFTGEGQDPPFRVRKWDVTSGRPVKEFSWPKDQDVAALAVSAGGRRLAAIGRDGSIRLWDVVTGQECWQAKGRALNYEAMAFSPDGMLLATFHNDVEFRDTRTGQRLATVPGRPGLAFSPDSSRLVVNGDDGTALVWDIEAVTKRPVGGKLNDVRQTQLWDDLAGDAALAAHAIDCWQAAPDAAAAFLARKLKPVAAVPAERITPLVAAIDSATFATRDRAARDLTALGPGSEAALRDVLTKQSSIELRRRIETVLAAWDQEHRRASRAVEVLETIATPAARHLLADLAKGDTSARLTREAAASLDRLRSRPNH